VGRVYADVTKFKKLEAAARAVPNSVRGVIGEIDALLATGSRTTGEREALEALRAEAERAHDAAKAFYGRFINADWGRSS